MDAHQTPTWNETEIVVRWKRSFVDSTEGKELSGMRHVVFECVSSMGLHDARFHTIKLLQAVIELGYFPRDEPNYGAANFPP